MSKKVSKKDLAERYASALFQDAEKNGVVDSVREEIKGLCQLQSESPEFNEFLTVPLLSVRVRLDTILAVADKLKVSTLMRNFLGVLAENGRLSLLSDIESAYDRLFDIFKGILKVRVVSAIPLDDDDTQHLTTVLNGIFDKQIRLDLTVDATLIGGLTVQVGSVMADASVKSKLRKLNLVMKGVGA